MRIYRNGTKKPNKEKDFDKAFSAMNKEQKAIVSAESFSNISRSMNSVKVNPNHIANLQNRAGTTNNSKPSK